MKYGRLNFSSNLDTFDRAPRLASEKRHAFRRQIEPEPPKQGRVCNGCDIHRTPNEFAYDAQREFVYCLSCRSRGGSKETRRK